MDSNQPTNEEIEADRHEALRAYGNMPFVPAPIPNTKN